MSPAYRPCFAISIQQVLNLERPDPTALAIGEVPAETTPPDLIGRSVEGKTARAEIPTLALAGLFESEPLAWAPALCARSAAATEFPVAAESPAPAELADATDWPIVPVVIAAPLPTPELFAPHLPTPPVFVPSPPAHKPLDLSFVSPGPNRLKPFTPKPQNRQPVLAVAAASKGLASGPLLPERAASPVSLDDSLFEEALGIGEGLSIPGANRMPAFLIGEAGQSHDTASSNQRTVKTLKAKNLPRESRRRPRRRAGAMILGFLTRSMVALTIALVSFMALRLGGLV